MNDAVRFLDLPPTATGEGRDAIEDIYRDALDVVVLRRAFDDAALARARAELAAAEVESGWHHPNAGIPGIGIRVLGTVATPTGTAPRGPDVAQYFANAAERRQALTALFGEDFDPVAGLEAALGRVAGGRPVELAQLADGRRYGPCTVRSLPEGQGIFLHNDYHYSIAVYDELGPMLDRSTCVSFFVVLQAPTQGGRICVYGLKRGEESDLPRLPSGLLDQVAVERRVPHTFFDLREGDLFVFSSGNLYHRVEAVAGSRTRVTIGGFLAFDTSHSRVLYWS
jgi:hypothetical protein